MKKSFLLALVFLAHASFAQSVLENSPVSVKWKRIKTDRFQLIYPHSFDGMSNEIAAYIDTIYFPASTSITDMRVKPIKIIIRNQEAISNGFVTLGPKRSEIYTAPSSNYLFAGTNDWLKMVVLHEFRHVAQFQQVQQGITGAAGLLLGNNMLAAISYSVLPQWFWEGDAVTMETALTASGRGRIPAFNSLFRANTEEKKFFNYNKQYLGSYKDAVPSHYVLGSNLVPWVRKNQDNTDVWKDVSAFAVKYPFIPFTFSLGLKQKTGYNLNQTYLNMMDSFKEDWAERDANVEYTPYTELSKSNKRYLDESYPVLIGGKLAVLKEGLNQIEQFSFLEDDTKIHTPGIVNNAGMIYADDRYILWNEYNFDPRWRTISYSDIKIFDFNTGKSRWITKKGRYTGAALNPTGTLIVSTASHDDYSHNIVLIDVNSGKEIMKIDNPDNGFYITSRFLSENELVSVKIDDKGKSMVLIDLMKGKETELIPSGNENFSNPYPYKNYIIYGSDYSGIDNIYAIDLESKNRFQLTSVKYGAYYPSVDAEKETLYFNVQTSNGLKVASMPLDEENWIPLPQVFVFKDDRFSQVIESEGNDLTKVPLTKEFESKPFRWITNVLNPHSWGPLVNTAIDEVELGVFSQDVMSTTTVSGGYRYDLYEKTGSWNGKLSYQGLYPIFDLEYEYGDREVTRFFTSTDETNLSWTEKKVSSTVRIPFLLTKSKYLTSLNLSLSTDFSTVSSFENSIDGGGRLFDFNGDPYIFRDIQDNGSLVTSRFSFLFANTLRTAKQHLEPRWGQVLVIENSNAIRGDFEGSNFSMRAYLYFPGILKSHTLNGHFAVQKRYFDLGNQDIFLYSNRIPLPRGVGANSFQQTISSSVNYGLPLWYPDLSIGPLLYVKRFTANAFFDFAYGTTDLPQYSYTNSGIFKSTGIELKADFHAMRFFPEINAGVRFSYGFEYGNTFEIIFPSIVF